MQKPINYLDFFQFFIHIPVAIFEDISDEEILEDCLEMTAYPIVIIKDNNHPLFIRIAEDFKRKGVTQKIKSIILTIGYNKPYLS
tara:strand:- start:9 stop:263 length:255 start_codon:yes stop_codon:yes gene_type:complete